MTFVGIRKYYLLILLLVPILFSFAMSAAFAQYYGNVLVVDVQTDRPVYVIGESMEITVTVSKVTDNPITLWLENKNEIIFNIGEFYLESSGILQVKHNFDDPILQRGEEYTIVADYLDVIEYSTIYASNFGARVELDKKIYSWNDKVSISISSPVHNINSDKIDEIGHIEENEITISTRGSKLGKYKFVETGLDTGIFTGAVTLASSTSGKTTEGNGPIDGMIKADDEDGITVSFHYSTDEQIIGSALIRILVEQEPIFAEKQIEVITEFDKETEQMILTLKGTDFYPDLKILWVVIHDIGIEFTIANGDTNSDAQGNFMDSANVKPLAESGNYIIRVIDIERNNFKERLELNNFPDNAISWTLTPKNFKVGESTVIDIKGTVNVDSDHNRDITIRVDQPDHQWAAVADRIPLTDDNEFHIAKKVNFRVPGEHLVVIEYNGLVRQSSFTVFTEESKLESEPTPSLQSQELESTKEPVPETIVEPEKLKIAPFVDLNKDPQYYIDRYNNEPSYKKWFHDNYPQYDSIEQAVGLELTQKIPAWVKNIFGWYAQDQIGEEELLNAIKYLINEKILVVN